MNLLNHKLKCINIIGVSNALKVLSVALLFSCFTLVTHAQTAEEIVDNYIENIGGQSAWSKVKSMTVTGVGRQQGVDYPFVATYMEDGRYVINVDIQGTSFIVEAFDGENAWAMNFQTQKAEALDSESSINTKNESKDGIVSPLFNYKEKGYKIELVGKETWEGSEVFKLKLTKTPALVDGKEEENVEFFFFDTENFVPLASEAVILNGQGKGATGQTVYSDYQEVDGLYIAFSQIDKFNGQVGLEMLMKKVEFNTEVDDSIFKMPKD